MIFVNPDHTYIRLDDDSYCFAYELDDTSLAAVEPYGNLLIYEKLSAIDMKSIRPLREGDTQRVSALEAEADALRSQLK